MDDTTIFNDHVELSDHSVRSFKAVLLEDSLYMLFLRSLYCISYFFKTFFRKSR